MYDKRQRGLQEAMGRVGMNNQRENPYSPFGGNVPAETLQTLNDVRAAPQPMQQPMERDGRYPRPPQAPQAMAPQPTPPGFEQGMRQIGIPQAPVPQAPQPQMNPRLQQLMQNPRFLEMLRRRRGMR